MTEQADTRFRARDGFGIAGFVLALVTAGFVLVLVLGIWKRFVRETAPVLLDWPGGPWVVGGLFGLMTVFGGIGGVRSVAGVPDKTRLSRVVCAAGTAICSAAMFGPMVYVLGALPGKNCPSYKESCRYIPGTGSAFLAYVITAALVGWLLFRSSSARAEARSARERERLRKLRKKGKGKSRAARRR